MKDIRLKALKYVIDFYLYIKLQDMGITSMADQNDSEDEYAHVPLAVKKQFLKSRFPKLVPNVDDLDEETINIEYLFLKVIWLYILI